MLGASGDSSSGDRSGQTVRLIVPRLCLIWRARPCSHRVRQRRGARSCWRWRWASLARRTARTQPACLLVPAGSAPPKPVAEPVEPVMNQLMRLVRLRAPDELGANRPEPAFEDVNSGPGGDPSASPGMHEPVPRCDRTPSRARAAWVCASAVQLLGPVLHGADAGGNACRSPRGFPVRADGGGPGHAGLLYPDLQTVILTVTK